MELRPATLSRVVLTAALMMTAAACGPNQAAAKPLTPAQKVHLAVRHLKTLTPLQTAASVCMHGLLGAAKNESIQKSLETLFAQQARRKAVGGVFTGFEVSGDLVKISDDMGGGQVFNAEFDLGRVLFAIFGAVPEFKLFGLMGQPAIDCAEAALWLDGTVGGQIGSLLAAKFNPPPVSPALLASRPSAISGNYTLYRRLVTCVNVSLGCTLNPMTVRVGCNGLTCTIIRTNGSPGGLLPWDHPIPLAFRSGAWQARGAERNAATCYYKPVPGTVVSVTLKIVSGSVVNGVWRARRLTGSYEVIAPADACSSSGSRGTEELSTHPF